MGPEGLTYKDVRLIYRPSIQTKHLDAATHALALCGGNGGAEILRHRSLSRHRAVGVRSRRAIGAAHDRFHHSRARLAAGEVGEVGEEGLAER